MIKKQPFIHKFRTKNNNYVYDIGTNHIIKVDEIIYDIIECCGISSSSEIMERFRWKYNINEIQERINSIEQAQDNGLFSHLEPNIKDLLDPGIIEWELNNYISLLLLEVTNKDNLQCKNYSCTRECYLLNKYYSKFMRFNLAKNCIDRYISHSSEFRNINVSFCGGEPLLNFEVIKNCVNYINEIAPEKERHYTIITNGTLLDSQTVEFLVVNNFRIIIDLNESLKIQDKDTIYENELIASKN